MSSSTVYLLHFLEPIGNHSNPRAMAQHYIGVDLNGHRVEDHTAGVGAKIVNWVISRGIGFVVAQRWPGGVELEKQLKARKCAPRFCPVCKVGLGAWLANQDIDIDERGS
jgi:hypothetical protein